MTIAGRISAARARSASGGVHYVRYLLGETGAPRSSFTGKGALARDPLALTDLHLLPTQLENTGWPVARRAIAFPTQHVQGTTRAPLAQARAGVRHG